MKESFENEVINEIEKRNVQDLIENNDESLIMGEIKREFKKMKIEGKRETGVIKNGDAENKTYYTVGNGNGRSRNDSWKSSRDFKDFRRSDSNNWRTQSENRWRRTQSKSMPRSRPRSASASRGSTTEYRTIKEFQDTVLKELKILKEKQDKLAKVQDEMVTKVLWAVDSFTRFIQGIVLNNKKAETVIEAL